MVLLLAGTALAGTGVLTPTPAQAVVSEYDPTDETHGCNFHDPFYQITYQGCFDATAQIADLTSGATAGDGKPVHRGDILQYTYTLTNNTSTTITDLSLYGNIPKYNCSPDPVCVYDPQFDVKNDWYTNSGFDPYSLRIEGDPDVNMGHVRGTLYDHGLELVGQAGHLQPYASADFRGYLPPGATTTTTFQIQVPYNAPIGSTYAMRMDYTHSDQPLAKLSGATARYAQVDALPTPTPTATATATSTPTATATTSPTATATGTPTTTGSATGTSTPKPLSTGSSTAPALPVNEPTHPETGAGDGGMPEALAPTGTPGNTTWFIIAGLLTAVGLVLLLTNRNRRPRHH